MVASGCGADHHANVDNVAAVCNPTYFPHSPGESFVDDFDDAGFQEPRDYGASRAAVDLRDHVGGNGDVDVALFCQLPESPELAIPPLGGDESAGIQCQPGHSLRAFSLSRFVSSPCLDSNS